MKWNDENFIHRRTCMLMVTHACNLNCSYCYEAYKQNAYMDIDLAKKIICREAKFVENSNEFNEIEIDFMGGEPLMNFRLIKNIVEWLEEGAIEIPWVCFGTTNGTLLTDEVKDWLKHHKDSIILSASYDGTDKMQFTNRGTEKHNIDLDFFYHLWPNQSLHMTISKETLPTLAEGILDIQRRGYRVDVALAQGVNWTQEDAVLYRKQLSLLKDAYLNNTSLMPINILRRYTYISNLPTELDIQNKWCGTGRHMAAYDVDGQKYGCHMFTPLVLGEDKALLSESVDWSSLELTADNYCRNCVLRNFCPTCLGFNYKYRGGIAIRDKRWCPMVLAEAMVATEFQVERIAALDRLEKEDAEYAHAALSAYHILKSMNIEKNQSPYMI